MYDSLTTEELYRAIHSLEHGATVVWYDPAAPASQIAQVTGFYDRRLQDAPVGQDRVIVAPYDFPGDPAGILPEGTQMAVVAWHRLRLCASVDLAVAFDFTSQYSFPTAEDREYAGVAPEPGARSDGPRDRWARGPDGEEEEAAPSTAVRGPPRLPAAAPTWNGAIARKRRASP